MNIDLAAYRSKCSADWMRISNDFPDNSKDWTQDQRAIALIEREMAWRDHEAEKKALAQAFRDSYDNWHFLHTCMTPGPRLGKFNFCKRPACLCCAEIRSDRRWLSKGRKSGFKAHNVIDLTGKTFGSWTVLAKGQSRRTKTGQTIPYWLCRCICGTEDHIRGQALRTGDSTRCRRCKYNALKGNTFHLSRLNQAFGVRKLGAIA